MSMMRMSEKMKTFSRILSVILVHTFLLSSIAFAVPQDKAPAPAAPKEVVTNPENIVIPREFGLVKSKFNSNNDRLVIHIQDAHCNFEAQSNIARIVEALVKNDSLKLVSVEGADGPIDTSWFKAFPDDAVRKEVAEYFMKKGEITGPEFLSITTDYPIKLFGAETRAYYIENLNAFTSSYPLKSETESYFNTIKAALNKLKGFIYNDDLREMDQKYADHEAKKIQFNDYVRFLQSEADRVKINLRAYDNLFKLINVLIYEKKIDFNVTDKERTNLIDDLTKRLEKDAITQLVTHSISFKIGKISSVDYYNYLKALAAANSIDMSKDYPNLYNYIIYNSVYSKIENEKLFHDIKKVETDIKEKLFANDDQRTLERLSRHIETLIGLVNIKLINGDFDYFKTHKDEYASEVFADFIQRKGAQYGLAFQIEPPTDAVTKSISKLEDFYAIAIKRDTALVDNTLAEMSRAGQKIAVLVTGGFHSEGIAKLLEKQGVSYMVVCPTITKDVPTPYIQVLTNQRTSFEDVVMGAAEAPAKGMLAPASITWAADLSDKDMRRLLTAAGSGESLEGKLEGRVSRVREGWTDLFLQKWISRSMQIAGEGLHRLARQEKVMQDAFAWAVEKKLQAMVDEGVIDADRKVAVKQRILDSEYFKADFPKIFKAAQKARVQGPSAEVGVTEKPAENNFEAAESEDGATDEAEDDSIRGKVVGASLTDKIVDRSMADKDTKFALIFGKDGERPEMELAGPKYTSLVDDLKAVIQTSIDEEDIEDIVRAIKATGVDTELLEGAFTKKNLLEAFKPEYGLKIKLVQPRDEFTGLRVPGIAMKRVGSNYGHYSKAVKTVYCAWGMADELLKDGTSLSRRMIVVNMLHELTEMVLLSKMYPKMEAAVAESYAYERIVHDVAERLERIIVGPGAGVGRSGLDDRLARMTDEYYREYTKRRASVAAGIFKMSLPDELYLWRMWQQYIDRRIHNRGTPQLRIIKDRDVRKRSDFDPLRHGNFLPACLLEEKELENILGTYQYDDLKKDADNAKAARKAVVTANSLDGGIGENVGRLQFLRNMRKDVLPEDIRMGAKGTDIGYFISYAGQEKIFVSIAEAKLLQLYTAVKSNKKRFSKIELEPLANEQSLKSYEELFDRTICIFDRFLPQGAKRRTYRQLLESVNIDVRPMLIQPDLPWIDKASGDIVLDQSMDLTKNKHQPGGHGQLLFRFLYEAWRSQPPAHKRPQIRVFYNGDNLNSGANEHIVGAMVRNHWPIVKLTTRATPFDKKGGKDGVRIKIINGKKYYIPDQMEEADAKKAGQAEVFYRAGMEDSLLKGDNGKQPFNTNVIYINVSLIRAILNELTSQGLVSEVEMLDIIAPLLMSKSAEQDKVKYAPIDGAAGVAVHRLNEFFLTSTDPRVQAVLDKFGVKRMLQFVDVPRTEFFTPVKKCFDSWLQTFSDYFKPLDTKLWTLEDATTNTPPDYEVKDYVRVKDPKEPGQFKLKDNDKSKDYWNELQNLIDTFGRASARDLRSLTINGRVILRDAILKGNVSILNLWSIKEAGRVKDEGGNTDTVKATDLSSLLDKSEELKRLYVDGRFILQDVSIVIGEDLSVTVQPYTAEAAEAASEGKIQKEAAFAKAADGDAKKPAPGYDTKMALALRDATAENAERWITQAGITREELDEGKNRPYADMFRDYDYRKTSGGQVSPAMAFRLGLTWAKMAIDRANSYGITDRRALVSIDARDINLENVTAMVSALRYAGLDVIFISADTPNCVSSYSWAHTEHNPLLGIFFTASHVVDKAGKGISGFKVVIKNRDSEAQSLTTQEIKKESKDIIRRFVGDGSENNIRQFGSEAQRKGNLAVSNVDANLLEMVTAVGRVAASKEIPGVDIYSMGRLFEQNKGPNGNKEEPIALLRKWLGDRIGKAEPLKGMKVVVEGANTPSGALAAETFKNLGAEVTLLNGEIVPATGKHKADPSIEDNLIGMKTKMRELEADFGMAFDLDGDRGAIIIPTERSGDANSDLQDAYQTLPPDIALVALLPFLKERAGYDPETRGKMAVVRDVLSTKAVDEMAEKLGITYEMTDAGYVFLKKRVRELKDAGATVPIYSERSGHAWLDVTGPLENPIAFNVLFAIAGRELAETDKVTLYPFDHMVKKNRVRPYKQSSRFQPLYRAEFLKSLGYEPMDKDSKPPQQIVAMGRDIVVGAILKYFYSGRSFLTPAGTLKVDEVKTYRDLPEEGGLYRYADIQFSMDEKFVGRFVFRASANDPIFVCSFETRVLEGEDEFSPSVGTRYDAIGALVLDWMERSGYARASRFAEYVNNQDAGGALLRYRAATQPLLTIGEDVAAATKALGLTEWPQAVMDAITKSVINETLLNNIAESVGIKKDAALLAMAGAGMATVKDFKKATYELTPDFYSAVKLNYLVARLIQTSDNPALVDLTTLRIERIILNSMKPAELFKTLAGLKSVSETVELLEMNGVFQTLTATWRLEEALKAPAKTTVPLKTADLVSPKAAELYGKEGVNVEFSLPRTAAVSPEALEALKNYQAIVAKDMAHGGYNYRGTGTKQSVIDFYTKSFAPKYRKAIQDFVNTRFENGRPDAIITNGIGANDQFMWSLARMYNENKPSGAPVWYHVTTAREFATIVKRDGLKGANTLFIDISRSGGTWEGIEVAMRSMAFGFNKRIAVANGGALVKIANAVAKVLGKEPLVIGMSPDIGGRNMHRKTSIYYTAQTVAGMFLPAMVSEIFAAMNNKFDVANGFATPEKSLPVSTGRMLFGSMRLMGVDHIALITNSEPLRLAGTEWEQYIMEGSNKEDVISLGIHDLTKEPEHVLANLAASPAGKKTIGMALLDKASANYAKELERVNKLKETMPLMIFTIDSSKANLKGGIGIKEQAAFDILWTDMVTVFTTLLRVDANSNPNVKVVREMTKTRVRDWEAAEKKYDEDLIGQGREKLLVSYGSPNTEQDKTRADIGTSKKQVGLNPQNAAEEARKLAKKLAEAGLLKGRNRLNFFVGREDLLELASELRSRAYASRLSTESGWITQTGLFPIWSHKGLEANLANAKESANPTKPLLADKTVNIFFNARMLDSGNEIMNKKFERAEEFLGQKEDAAIDGATIHQTNDAMTMPNIKRMAEVSPTVLFEFKDTEASIVETIRKFSEALMDEISAQVEAEKSRASAAVKRDVNGGDSVGTPGAGVTGGRPEVKTPAKAAAVKRVVTGPRLQQKPVEQNVASSGRPATQREQYIYDTYVRADAEAMHATLMSLSMGDQKLRKPVILVYDTGIEPDVDTSQVARAADAAITRYLNDTVSEVRGTGTKLLDKIRAAAAYYNERNITDYTVVTIVGDDTLGAINAQRASEGKAETGLKDDLGKIINVKTDGKRYIPIIALYDVALRWAYEIDLESVAARLTAMSADPGNPITVKKLMEGIVKFLPRLEKVSLAEAVEAYKAAQQALQSL